MKKVLILLLPLVFACGPSEDEIQAQINSSISEKLIPIENNLDDIEIELDTTEKTNAESYEKINESFENLNNQLFSLENKLIYTNFTEISVIDDDVSQKRVFLYCDNNDSVVGGGWKKIGDDFENQRGISPYISNFNEDKTAWVIYTSTITTKGFQEISSSFTQDGEYIFQDKFLGYVICEKNN
tara:strand:+ start:127 stop:678 length:552 start_codon:yes stop_codon:yes gene_type:complete